MLHQAHEEGQVRRGDALLVERQDPRTGGGLQQVVGVFHALGDALGRDEVADVVAGHEGAQIGIVDFGVNGHGDQSRVIPRGIAEG